jgi:hypothetical protein
VSIIHVTITHPAPGISVRTVTHVSPGRCTRPTRVRVVTGTGRDDIVVWLPCGRRVSPERQCTGCRHRIVIDTTPEADQNQAAAG